MTAPDDPTLSPAEEAAVRARLAEARHTAPVPDDVVTRLDAALAELTAERREADPAALAPVVPLGSRRRRALTSGLVAAAAVVVLGVALPQVLDSTGTSGGGDSASSADGGGSADQADEVGPAEAGPAEDRDGSGKAAGSAPSQLSSSPEAAESERTGSAFAAPVPLSSTQALRPAVRPLTLPGAVTSYAPSPRCRLDVGDGERVDATWDGLPALVVLRPAQDGRQVVDVYLCGSDEAVDSTSLRAR
ncbi:hypothetical protein [Nocardioides sp. P5_C9_2]